MKNAVLTSLLLLLFTFSMPLLTIYSNPAATSPYNTSPPSPSLSALPAQPIEALAIDANTMVLVLIDGTVCEMPMDQYLQGVVSAEMPASFELEALKAQVVAARTYTIYKMECGSSNHPNADVCTDHMCCSAYISKDVAAANWGEAAETYSDKIRTAVAETDGMTALYEGAPILAVFHSSSSSFTKSAKDVWSSDLPYLQSVTTPEGVSAVPNYYSRTEVSPSDFKAAVLSKYPDANLSGNPGSWFQNDVRTPSNGVITIEIGGVTVAGTAIRSLFSLRSTSFEVAAEESTIVFTTTGYGHGVGMSQYGSNVLASQGKTYVEILEWYYTGISIQRYCYEK